MLDINQRQNRIVNGLRKNDIIDKLQKQKHGIKVVRDGEDLDDEETSEEEVHTPNNGITNLQSANKRKRRRSIESSISKEEDDGSDNSSQLSEYKNTNDHHNQSRGHHQIFDENGQ